MPITKEFEKNGIVYDATYRVTKNGVVTNPSYRADKRMTKAENVPVDIQEKIKENIKNEESGSIPAFENTPPKTEIANNEVKDIIEKGDDIISRSMEQELADRDLLIEKLENEVKALEDMLSEPEDEVNAAEKLFKDYGIYTPLLNRPPKPTEKSPLTGETFNRFTFGQSLQAWKQFNAKGIIKLYNEEEVVPFDDYVEKNSSTEGSVVEDVNMNAVKEPKAINGKNVITEDEALERKVREIEANHRAVRTMQTDKTDYESYSGQTEEPSPRPPINAAGIPQKIWIDTQWGKTATISPDGKTRLR